MVDCGGAGRVFQNIPLADRVVLSCFGLELEFFPFTRHVSLH